MERPYLTITQPGIGGQLKVKPEDFFVEEIPLYSPLGEGQHIHVEIEKRGLSTFAAIDRLARALNISPRNIGYAGLKDAHAVTRQTVSIEGVAIEAIQVLDIPDVKVLSINRHRNKLKIGHLAGNRFVIKVRQVTEDAALPVAKAVLHILEERGVPNFFGEQRFGNRGNTNRLGEMIIRKNVSEFVSEYLGRPRSQEAAYVQAVRRLIDEGQWAEALAQWPGNLPDERAILGTIVKAGGQFNSVFRKLNKRLKSFFVSAFQSQLFNQLLAQRLDTLDKLEDGDVAYIHHKGASFVVENSVVEQARVDRFEISPSGPLFGPKTILAEGRPGQRERVILTEQGLTINDFKVPGLRIRGARRPYRFKLEHTKIRWDDGLVVSFELQPGAYATNVMAEITKSQ